MNKRNRDDFTTKTRHKIGRQSSWLCSDPSCRRSTVGSDSEGEGEIDLGVAAHICAAAPGGPRFDPEMKAEERKSASNGIWLCQNHAKLVVTKDPMFTVELLREWKAQAQQDSWRNVRYNDVPDGDRVQQSAEDDLSAHLRAAAATDLGNFRRSDTWPATPILRTLRVEGLDEPFSTSRVAEALATLDDLVIVAEPGMGKTTTLFQVAEAVLENGYGSPMGTSKNW